MSRANLLFRNFFILFFGNIIGQLFFLFGIVKLARVVGPGAFGVWSYAQAWYFYLLRGGEFGLEVTGIRAIAKDQRLLKARVSETLALRLIMATLLSLTMLIVVGLGIIPGQAASLVLLFTVGLFPVAVSVEWLYEAVQQPRNVGIARLLKGLLFFLLVALAVRAEHQLQRAALFYIVSLLAPALFLIYTSTRTFGLKSLEVSWERAKGLLGEAVPIAVATLLSQYSLFFGTIFLGYVASDLELGFFAAPHRLILFLWAYGIVASNRVLLPSMCNLHENDSSQYVEFLSSVTKVLSIIAVPIGVLGAFVSKDLITLVYGESFASSAPLFAILVWALVIAVGRSGLEIGLIASHRQKAYVSGMTALAVTHSALIPLGYFLKGVEGVALATVVAESLYAGFLTVASGKAVLRRIWKSSLSIALGAGITSGTLTVLSLSSWFSIPVGLLVYGILLTLLGEVSKSDLRRIKELNGF